MITIDSRVGSAELAGYFKNQGQAYELGVLKYGDFAFEGNGPEGKIKVAIERKTWPDFINSTSSNRFNGDQLIGLIENYDDVYLFLEGVSRANPETSSLEYQLNGQWTSGYSKPVNWHAIMSQIATFEHCGVKVRFPINPYNTVSQAINLFQWYNRPWESHDSHNRLKNPKFDVSRATDIARVARALGLGHAAARKAEKGFESVKAMINCAPEDWVIKGVVSSAAMATKIHNACNRVRVLQNPTGKMHKV